MITKSYILDRQKKGLIKLTPHDSANLQIANYTPNVQYGWLWDDIIMQCRGLILDLDFNIVSRPFPKFFNLEELKETQIPNEPFEVYEKLDGSLGIMYWLDGMPYIATRGAFHSDQAIRANGMLYSKYSHCIQYLNPNHTYLFEIIYPENRIVVDYGEMEKLVLLAVIDTQTGNELPFPYTDGFPVVDKYDGIEDYVSLAKEDSETREGYVIKFKSGFRMKIKFDTYKKLHKIVTGLSEKTIWEWLKDGVDVDNKLMGLPDEFYKWGKGIKEKLLLEHKTIYSLNRSKYNEIIDSLSKGFTRKEFAEKVTKYKHPAPLFMLHDGKDINDYVWKQLIPQK